MHALVGGTHLQKAVRKIQIKSLVPGPHHLPVPQLEAPSFVEDGSHVPVRPLATAKEQLDGGLTK